MVASERVWLDRWRFHSKSDWPTTPDTIDELEAMFAEHASKRTNWFESDPEVLSNAIEYRDLKGELHVQRLGGRQWGLEVGEAAVSYEAPDLESLTQYCRYGDWAMNKIFDQCRDLTDEQLDQDRGMGVGTLRKSLLHIYDAESFWQSNWETEGIPFPSTPVTTSVGKLAMQWSSTSEKKSDFMQRSGQSQLGRTVTVDVGGGPMEFRLSESLLQLSVHGTLHRSQATNMIRSIGKTPEALDYVVWLRQTT